MKKFLLVLSLGLLFVGCKEYQPPKNSVAYEKHQEAIDDEAYSYILRQIDITVNRGETHYYYGSGMPEGLKNRLKSDGFKVKTDIYRHSIIYW